VRTGAVVREAAGVCVSAREAAPECRARATLPESASERETGTARSRAVPGGRGGPRRGATRPRDIGRAPRAAAAVPPSGRPRPHAGRRG